MATARGLCGVGSLSRRTNHRVFSYGSNLTVARIEERVGPVVVLSTGRLPGHALRFHKMGRDGSGKADAYATAIDDDVVCGVVYEMPGEAKRKLDRFEGVGSEYLANDVVIVTSAEEIRATVYCAHPRRIDPNALPFDWYHRLVVDGARQHHLPGSYIDRIAAHPVRIDPDRVRADRALRLLSKP